MTGGSLHRYHPFCPARDHAQLVNDVLWAVRRERGGEAMLRLRCSLGVDVDRYIGSCVRRETGARCRVLIGMRIPDATVPLQECCDERLWPQAQL
jgi:hypothetical protein